jgi:hypothetical protein
MLQRFQDIVADDIRETGDILGWDVADWLRPIE